MTKKRLMAPVGTTMAVRSLVAKSRRISSGSLVIPQGRPPLYLAAFHDFFSTLPALFFANRAGNTDQPRLLARSSAVSRTSSFDGSSTMVGVDHPGLLGSRLCISAPVNPDLLVDVASLLLLYPATVQGDVCGGRSLFFSRI